MMRRVEVSPQRVYGSVPLLLPLMKMSEAEAIKMDGEPQIYDRDYPLDYDGLGLSPAWSANTGLGDLASFGNVAYLPHEVAQMSGLGLTPAQLAAQAKRQAAQAAAAKKKADAVAQRQANVAARQATVAAKKVAHPIGVKNTPSKPTAAQKQAQAKCLRSGGTWDSVNNKCLSASDQAQQQCVAAGNYWNGTICVTKDQQTCVGAGNTWDPTTGVCITNPAAPKPCPNIVPQCGPGMIIGNDANGCPVICVPDPNYQNPAIAQCQQTGGYWNGTYCTPPAGTNYPPPPPPGGGALSPIPPGYDGGGGGGAPMSSGGGFPMTPGAPPQSQNDLLNQSSGNYAPQVDPQDQSSDADTDDTKDKADSDSSQVASGGILDSISKFFSGMNGLGCGCNAPPPWIGMGGTNLPQFATAQPVPPVKSSTSTAVVVGSVVLIAAAAAIFLWSKGKK